MQLEEKVAELERQVQEQPGVDVEGVISRLGEQLAQALGDKI